MGANAAERGGINLGSTSFFDGFSPTDAWACGYLHYNGYFVNDAFNGPDGNKIADNSLRGGYTTAQVACNSGWTVLGGRLGATIIVPTMGHDVSPSPPLSDNGVGLGDITFGPSLQFLPVKRGGRVFFSHGVEIDILAPSGKYDVTKTVNPGNGYWSIVPFWKATLLPVPQWEISWRISYIHNFEYAPIGVTRHTGDGVWLNFATSYEVYKDLYLGLNGYWLKQLDADEIGGVNVSNSKQESLHIGPGFHYTFPSKDVLNFNVYFDVVDKNAFSDGVAINMQYAHPF
jgi:hypothetical protein